MKVDWIDFTAKKVADKVGPAAQIVIKHAHARMTEKQQQMNSSRDYLVFLKQLKRELPEGVNKKELCDALWIEMMNQKVIF